MMEPINVQELRRTFADAQMPGVIAIIDEIIKAEQQQTPLVELGSNSIDPPQIRACLGDVYEAISTNFGFRGPFFYIGRPASRDGKYPAISPLHYLWWVSQIMNEIPADSRIAFDTFCKFCSDADMPTVLASINN